MFVLGLTGSLGMGKSTTAAMFAEQGVPVHDADAAVHRLYEGKAASLIEAEFPGTTRDGKVDRAKLGERVLGNDAAMRKLEQIVHPLVRKAEERFLVEAMRNGTAVAVLDIPLLFETGAESRCDAVAVVSASPEQQRARAFERPDMTEPKFQAILAKQMPDADKRARADFVVDTGQGLDHARGQVSEILRRVGTMETRRR